MCLRTIHSTVGLIFLSVNSLKCSSVFLFVCLVHLKAVIELLVCTWHCAGHWRHTSLSPRAEDTQGPVLSSLRCRSCKDESGARASSVCSALKENHGGASPHTHRCERKTGWSAFPTPQVGLLKQRAHSPV